MAPTCPPIVESPIADCLKAVVLPTDLRARHSAAIVLAPFGIGNHIDHVEVFLAAVLALPAAERERLFFYEDAYAVFPAARQRHFTTRLLALGPHTAARPSLQTRLFDRVLAWATAGPPLEQFLPKAVLSARWCVTPVAMKAHQDPVFPGRLIEKPEQDNGALQLTQLRHAGPQPGVRLRADHELVGGRQLARGLIGKRLVRAVHGMAPAPVARGVARDAADERAPLELGRGNLAKPV